MDADDVTLSPNFRCPLMSLPLSFKTDITTIPAEKSYLGNVNQQTAAWNRRLGPKIKPRVGVVWSGSPAYKNDHNRSINLETLQYFFKKGFQYISLQIEVSDKDMASLGSMGMVYLGSERDDFANTAALCHLIDVVVSVDTSVAHLAEALGKPVWVSLPWLADWRRMLDREDSPWYPLTRLFRQKVRRDWNSVLQEVAQELDTLRKEG